MGKTLDKCLSSTIKMCGELPIIVIDDQSDDLVTRSVLKSYERRIERISGENGEKAGRRHGNLYGNINLACAYAIERGYEYLMMI
ncbi:glycosyltransferase family A protein [Jannaschia rubra]|uniref:glycosyltransferase family A protein n=1 Tax=Jannaschia rubra TaxID=282197 RepID=UPI0024902494|nr:glycosyltransferase family A protein [Jannaschia rubra]